MITINISEARVICRQLSHVSQHLYEQSNRVNHSLNTVRSAWRGQSQEEFSQEMDYRLRELRRLASEMAELASRMNRKIEEWEAIDSRF